MKIRILLYLLILFLGIILATIQYVAVKTQTGNTVTIPEIGYFDVPKAIFPLLFLDLSLMIPWIILNMVGSIFNTEWVQQTRFWVMLIAAFSVVITFAFRGNYTFIPWDITWLYLLTEGALYITKAST